MDGVSPVLSGRQSPWGCNPPGPGKRWHSRLRRGLLGMLRSLFQRCSFFHQRLPCFSLAAPVAVHNASAYKCTTVWWEEMQQGSGSEACPEYHLWIPTYSSDIVILKPEGTDLPVQAVHKLVTTADSWWLPVISLVRFPCLWAATLQDFFPTLWHSWSTLSLTKIHHWQCLAWGATIRSKDGEFDTPYGITSERTLLLGPVRILL